MSFRGIGASDLHFHKDNKNNQTAIALIEKIRLDYPGHYVFLTGDSVDDGHEAQYEKARYALRDISHKTFVVPGNHDYGICGNFYDRDREKLFFETFQFLKSTVVDGVLLIGLDSNLKTVHPWDFACGEIGQEQLEWLDATLNNARSLKRVVYMHHHPFVHNNPFMELKDGKDLIKTLYNRVDLLLFGHKHESGLWTNTCGIKRIHASGNPPDFWEFEI